MRTSFKKTPELDTMRFMRAVQAGVATTLLMAGTWWVYQHRDGLDGKALSGLLGLLVGLSLIVTGRLYHAKDACWRLAATSAVILASLSVAVMLDGRPSSWFWIVASASVLGPVVIVSFLGIKPMGTTSPGGTQ